METSYSGAICRVCEERLQAHHFAMFNRTQTVSANGKTILPLYEMHESYLCGAMCAEALAEAAADGNCSPIFQPFAIVATCSECGKSVDRQKPHRILGYGEYLDKSTPWLVSAQPLDEREIAVFCPDCWFPYVEDPDEDDGGDEVVWPAPLTL